MKEFIEKLFVALEEQAESVTNDFAEEMYKYIKIEDVKNIVNQLAEEYSKDQNWQTTRNYLDEKYFSKIRELSANYNHPCEDIPINFDWVFGLIEKMEMQLAEEHKDKEVLSMAEITANHSKAVLEELKRIRDGGWIPCSERLPEPIDDMLQCVIVTDENDWQGMAYYHPQKGWLFAECHNSDRKIDWTEIIAWQPLPAPYQPKGE